MDICKAKDICGGCTSQGIPYEKQLEIKGKQVLDLIEAKKLHIDKIEEIEPAPEIFGYRNKMEYTFGDLEKDGELTLGMHKKRHFMSIVTVDECMLVHDDFNKILRAVLNWAKENGYTKYHKKTHKGLLRHLVIRRGIKSNQILVNIITTSEDGFDEKGFVNLIKRLSLEHKIAGILRTINDELADAVKCNELRVLFGKPSYDEEISGLKFKVAAFSFFQTNVLAAERLYKEAIALIDNLDEKTVFDLFCGTGTITQIASQKAKKAVGIELVAEAIETAKESAYVNGLSDKCEFIAGDVFDVMENISEKPDVIIADPPRMGIAPKALDKIISYSAEQIVYISCNPKTLIENLYYLQYNGYDVKYLKPFDNFPNTKHTECIALLYKR